MAEGEPSTRNSCRAEIEKLMREQIGLLEDVLGTPSIDSLTGQVILGKTLREVDVLERQISDLCGLPSPLISCPVRFGGLCPKADSKYNVELKESSKSG